MRMRAFGVALATVAIACSDSGPSGPSGGGFEGRYSGTHRFSFGGIIAEITCTGSLVIIDLRGAVMTGTMTVDPCEELDTTGGTTLVSGSLSSSGTLAFTVPGQEDFVEDLAEAGCTVTELDPGFAGTVENRRIDASFTATVECPGVQGPIPFAWRLDMTKAT